MDQSLEIRVNGLLHDDVLSSTSSLSDKARSGAVERHRLRGEDAAASALAVSAFHDSDGGSADMKANPRNSMDQLDADMDLTNKMVLDAMGSHPPLDNQLAISSCLSEVNDKYTNYDCNSQGCLATRKKFQELDVLGRPHNPFTAVDPNCNLVLKRRDTEENPGPKKRARFHPEFKVENEPISHAVPRPMVKDNKAVGPDYTSLIENSAVAVNILCFLSVWDVLSLGCCSKYLHAVCESDGTWKDLFERRWQSASEIADSSKEIASTSFSNYKEWKVAYVGKHRKMASMIPMALKPLNNIIHICAIDGCNYFEAVGHLKQLKLKFEDIYFFLFKKDLNVKINMVAMHYAFFCLGLPVKDLKMALMSSGVAEKKVRLKWSLGSQETMPNERYSEVYSLGEIADMDMAVLYLLIHHRTHAHETQISSIKIAPYYRSYRQGQLSL